MDLGKLLSDHAKVYCIGIKGTGISALAELLVQSGLSVSGSDTAEIFYTDAILKKLGIPYFEGFDASHVPPDAALVIHSAAYSPESNPEMGMAVKLGLPLIKYTDALGEYSALFDSTGIAGVHGKTTTTALAGVLFRAASLPAKILAGSAVASFNGCSTLSLGSKYFVAETCEYRKHFLAFRPQRIVLTSVESDHQDFFPVYNDIRDAFLEYALKIPPGGELIYCADDPGACEVTGLAKKIRNDINAVPYGFSASGDFKITSYRVYDERSFFKIAAFPGSEFSLRIPGRHSVLNAAAALALTVIMSKKEFQGSMADDFPKKIMSALDEFSGSRRRSEITGEKDGILFMDDYAHHPTAIASTLCGLKEFYPQRRLVVSFMSHTFSRTAALLDDFAASLLPADIVFLHKIYASAREEYSGGVNGLSLYEKTKEVFKKERNAGDRVFYVDEPLDACDPLKTILQKGDLFITMGAGNNWSLGQKLLRKVGVYL